MFKFCAAIGFGLMLVMGGAVLAEDQPLDPDMVFPENEPPFIDPLPPIEFPDTPTSTDPDSVFPENEPPFIGPMPSVEFPEAPEFPEEDGFSVAGPPLWNLDLFPPDESRVIEYTMPPAIPDASKDGDLEDGLQAVLQAGLTTIQDDLVSEFTERFPGATDALDQLGNLASEHPYATAGFGAGLLIVGTVATQAGLEEYGDNLNIDTVKMPLPPYQNDNLQIPFLNYTIGISVSGEIKLFMNTADVYGKVEFRW